MPVHDGASQAGGPNHGKNAITGGSLVADLQEQDSAFGGQLTRRRMLKVAVAGASGIAAGIVGGGSPARSQAAPGDLAHRAFVPLLASDGTQPAAPPGPTVLSYVAGSTIKVEQLIGDYDKQAKTSTVNLTESRYGIVGTDLGSSFEHNGKLYFLFGDTVGKQAAADPIGFSQSSDSGSPLTIEFLSSAPGTFIPVTPHGLDMGPFDVPIHGISLNGNAYVAVVTNHSASVSTDKSVLTSFDEGARTFTPLREISHLPGGFFINVSLRLAPTAMPGLPGAGQYVLMFGSGEYRKSNAYLAALPAAGFATGANTSYFAGIGSSGPRWSDNESDAVPIVAHPVIGELCVIFVAPLALWVMTYNSSEPRGIVLRYASAPWGPWSDPQIIFNPDRDRGYGAFMHDPRIKPSDGLDGPVTVGNAAQIFGGEYAPYVIERFTAVSRNQLTLHYVMSTWNPYTVVRMRSTLAVQR